MDFYTKQANGRITEIDNMLSELVVDDSNDRPPPRWSETEIEFLNPPSPGFRAAESHVISVSCGCLPFWSGCDSPENSVKSLRCFFSNSRYSVFSYSLLRNFGNGDFGNSDGECTPNALQIRTMRLGGDANSRPMAGFIDSSSGSAIAIPDACNAVRREMGVCIIGS